MDPRFEDWLRKSHPVGGAAGSRLSNLRGLERHFGDLDAEYDGDGFKSLFGKLEPLTPDGRPNPAAPKIDGNVNNGLATLRSAANLYVRFRQQLHRNGIEPDAEVLDVETSSVDDSGRIFTMERDLQSALRKSIGQLEPGLEIVDGGQERVVPSGKIDILARDAAGRAVVIELKAVKAQRDAVAQVLAYMGDLLVETPDREVRGLLVAPEFDAKAVAATRAATTLKLVRYTFSFKFSPHEW